MDTNLKRQSQSGASRFQSEALKSKGKFNKNQKYTSDNLPVSSISRSRRNTIDIHVRLDQQDSFVIWHDETQTATIAGWSGKLPDAKREFNPEEDAN